MQHDALVSFLNHTHKNTSYSLQDLSLDLQSLSPILTHLLCCVANGVEREHTPEIHHHVAHRSAGLKPACVLCGAEEARLAKLNLAWGALTLGIPRLAIQVGSTVLTEWAESGLELCADEL